MIRLRNSVFCVWSVAGFSVAGTWSISCLSRFRMPFDQDDIPSVAFGVGGTPLRVAIAGDRRDERTEMQRTGGGGGEAAAIVRRGRIPGGVHRAATGDGSALQQQRAQVNSLRAVVSDIELQLERLVTV